MSPTIFISWFAEFPICILTLLSGNTLSKDIFPTFVISPSEKSAEDALKYPLALILPGKLAVSAPKICTISPPLEADVPITNFLLPFDK